MTALETAITRWGHVRLHPGGKDPRIIRRAKELKELHDAQLRASVLGRNPLERLNTAQTLAETSFTLPETTR